MLHTNEVLTSLAAEEAGVVRDWALARLAVVAPDTVRGVPDDVDSALLVALCTPDGVERTIQALADGRPVASALCDLGRLGRWPADLGPLIAAARGALSFDPIYAAELLLAAGVAEPAMIHAVIERKHWLAKPIAAATALRLAGERGLLDVTAEGVVRELDEDDLGVTLSMLHAPRYRDIEELVTDPDEVARIGALLGGGALPRLQPKGSARRRAQAWIRGLTDGLPGPIAALLRAIGRQEQRGLYAVATAAWLRATGTSDDPVADVMLRGRCAPSELGAAVRALTDADSARLAAAEQSPEGLLGLLVAQAQRTGDAAMIDAVLDELSRDFPNNLNAVLVATVCPTARVVELLDDPSRRLLGLMSARWRLDEAALRALLTMPVPAEPDERGWLVEALAASGDPSAAPLLRDLYALDPRLWAAPRERFEALLGAPLDTI